MSYVDVRLTRQEHKMRARWPILATFVILGAGYIGYPYVTLYRLGVAVRHSDAATLRTLVDWYSVREGLKEDICDMVLDGPVEARPDNQLPPFGASFVRGMTGNALDQTVTPETLVSLSQSGAASPGAAGSRGTVGSQGPMADQRSDPRVVWAFFDNPTEFSVALRTEGVAEPIRVVMELRGMSWQVRRVWLPNQMLEHAGPGT
jgi:hypothetical protein